METSRTETLEYDHQQIEARWQRYWEEIELFRAVPDTSKPKYYVLEMFPYPSGQLHMGHARNYTIGDTIARYYLMRGYNVLHPFGWDAFGLPAENAAMKHGVHPREWTERNIANMKRQLRSLGIGYDWSREVKTCDPEYYKWNQWIFLKMYEKGLVYRKEAPVNWCPNCRTVLANEQVIGGTCWRCGTRVTKKNLKQWFIRLTAYADSLLEGIDKLDGWPEKVKVMQRNWIGKSRGVKVKFFIPELDDYIWIFTTRPDTLPGVTFMAVAPEHPLVKRAMETGYAPEGLKEFLEDAYSKTNVERAETKTGMPLGLTAVNPINGERIPIWVANYVLMDYAEGAIMAVPAHDQRDYEFAKQYNLPIKPVIKPVTEELPEDRAYEGEGIMFNCGKLGDVKVDGMDSSTFKYYVTQYLKYHNLGEEITMYRLKDWLISRQRYWGTPIPIIYCEHCGIVPVPEDQLPVKLPDVVDFEPPSSPELEGRSPLAKVKEFVETTCPRCGRKAVRETDTMDTFFDSSWYFWRYTSANLKDKIFDMNELNYWLPVDQYIGGIEHAVGHLLYLRFFAHFLNELGYVPQSEPIKNLLNQGMVLKGGEAMSKSKGNIVSIEETLNKYGADAARMFELFAAPPEKDIEWSEHGIEGVSKFLRRFWRYVNRWIENLSDSSYRGEDDPTPILKAVYKTAKKITSEFETRRFHFNTCIAALMELLNELESYKLRPPKDKLQEIVEAMIKMIAPFGPHIAEELWHRLGHETSVFRSGWINIKEEYLKEETFTLVLQVNGKVRSRIEVPTNITEDEAKRLALEDERLKQWLEGKEIVKIIYVPRKLVNVVVK